MNDLTRRAQEVIDASGTEQSLSPDESLAFLKNPANFQSFAAYIERLVKEKGIDMLGMKLSDFLAKGVIGLDPSTTEPEKRRIRRFFKETAWKIGGCGVYESLPNIRRDVAIKLCFCLKLNEIEANDFLRKACSMYGLNIRDAWEATCFYCILTAQPYTRVLDIMREYAMISPEIQTGTDVEDKGTQTLKAELKTLVIGPDHDFLYDFLIPNKASFTEYSRTLVRKYSELRTSLCSMILDSHLESLSSADKEQPAEMDPPYNRLISAATALAHSDEDFREIVEDLKNGTDKLSAYEELKNAIIYKYDDVPADVAACVISNASDRLISSGDFVDMIANYAVTDDLLINEMLWGVPYLWNRGNQTGLSAYGRSSLSKINSSILDNFPKADYFSSILEDPVDGKGNDNVARKRKILILFYFTYYFYGWLVSYDPINLSLNERKRRYDSFYNGLNYMLSDCNMVCVYPADPYDWLILKSAAAFLKMDEDNDPIEFFNDVIRLSFDTE